MAKNKTQPTKVRPADFIAAVDHPTRRADAEVLLEMMTRVSGFAPKMWGPTIIGFGRYHYKYESGREGDSLMIGFSPRKANLVLYIMPGYDDISEPLSRLGKHKHSKSCLYINKLADIDMNVLEEIVAADLVSLKSNYETWGA